MSREYTEVPTGPNEEKHVQSVKVPSKYFRRQLLVASIAWTAYCSSGVVIGTPTVFVPQFRREANSTAAVTPETVSWLACTFSYASIPWGFILPFLMNYFGRRKTSIFISFNQVIFALAYYFSTTPTHLLITEAIHGPILSATLNLSIICITEFTSPTNRGPLLTIKSATTYWSVWIVNTIGAFASWKYISIVCFVNAVYSLTIFFTPESPSWLALQGRYDECRKAHRWLRGHDKQSELELETLITSQEEVRTNKKKKNVKNMFHFLLEKEFFYPMLLTTVMILTYQSSGKIVVTMYSIEILKKITSSESTAYVGMLILDGASVFAMYTGCFMSKFFKRRTLLFCFGGASVFFHLTMSLYLYLVHLSYISQNKYISLALLVGFSISISMGPLVLMTSICGELIPLRYAGEATITFASIFSIIQGTLLKNTPQILKYLDIHGMFLFYGTCVSICLIILYRFLPETKDKTLQEIESYFKSKNRS